MRRQETTSYGPCARLRAELCFPGTSLACAGTARYGPAHTSMVGPGLLSLDPPRKSGWSFSGAGLGGLILSVAVGVVFRPLTFVRLVHRFLPGMLAAVAAWAVGVW